VNADEELIDAALAGSAEAFGELVERYQAGLFRFLLTRSATRADAEDALQDTFLAAFRYLASYRRRWRFSTWLYRIAIRNAARRRERPMELPGEAADEGADVLEQCIRDSDADNVWRVARRALSREAQAALWLRYAEDLPVREVARALGRSQAWTKVTLLRARRRLSAELARDGAGANEGKVKAYG
jgi:RNA polymerase sigma-70 factor (ECF subfamily)